MRQKDDMEALEARGGEDRNGRAKRKSPSPASKAMMTRNIRLAYGEVEREKLPQDMLELLDKIDEALSNRVQEKKS